MEQKLSSLQKRRHLAVVLIAAKCNTGGYENRRYRQHRKHSATVFINRWNNCC